MGSVWSGALDIGTHNLIEFISFSRESVVLCPACLTPPPRVLSYLSPRRPRGRKDGSSSHISDPLLRSKNPHTQK